MHIIVNVYATAQYHSVTETLCGKMTSAFPDKIILVMKVQSLFVLTLGPVFCKVWETLPTHLTS